MNNFNFLFLLYIFNNLIISYRWQKYLGKCLHKLIANSNFSKTLKSMSILPSTSSNYLVISRWCGCSSSWDDKKHWKLHHSWGSSDNSSPSTQTFNPRMTSSSSTMGFSNSSKNYVKWRKKLKLHFHKSQPTSPKNYPLSPKFLKYRKKCFLFLSQLMGKPKQTFKLLVFLVKCFNKDNFSFKNPTKVIKFIICIELLANPTIQKSLKCMSPMTRHRRPFPSSMKILDS